MLHRSQPGPSLRLNVAKRYVCRPVPRPEHVLDLFSFTANAALSPSSLSSLSISFLKSEIKNEKRVCFTGACGRGRVAGGTRCCSIPLLVCAHRFEQASWLCPAVQQLSISELQDGGWMSRKSIENPTKEKRSYGTRFGLPLLPLS